MKDQSEEERQRVVSEYETWLWQQISNNKITKEDLLKLNGKKLVCYCAPKDCHGNVVKNAIELLLNNEKEFDNIIKEYCSKKLKP